MTLWTIGHSNRTLADFLALLQTHQIQGLADVRRFPASRRYPYFNGPGLAEALAEADIEYVHFADLGGRRKARADSPNTGWRNESFRGYADYLQTPEFKSAMRRLLMLANRRRTAVMCAEALWWQCHRSLIADALKAQGHEVLHILSTEKVEEHPYTSPARIVNGELQYNREEEVPELPGLWTRQG